MNTLSDRQAAELREIADGGRDTNRHLWTRAFRDGRDHARSRLRDLLDSEDRDTFETAANEMDAEALLFEDWFSDGFSSVIDEVCAVLPSWPWLPDATAAGRALLDSNPERNRPCPPLSNCTPATTCASSETSSTAARSVMPPAGSRASRKTAA